MQIFSIKGELTDLNSYVKALNSNRFSGNNIKREETERVYVEAISQKLRPVQQYPVLIDFIWYSKDKRKDIDNIAFAKKFILDGLVMAGVLQNDSRKHVSSFSDTFYIDKENPRTEVRIRLPNKND